jgi:hypothetical protein
VPVHALRLKERLDATLIVAWLLEVREIKAQGNTGRGKLVFTAVENSL